jgi:DNA-directed RNA polymerase subunit RPC12/RpoP
VVIWLVVVAASYAAPPKTPADPVAILQQQVHAQTEAIKKLGEEFRDQRRGTDLERRYLDIVDRVSTQLNIGWTPYGVTFTVLSSLIAIMAIFATALIVLQSREYRKAREEERRTHETQLKDQLERFTKEWTSFFTEAKAQSEEVKTLIEALKKASEQADEVGKQLAEKRKGGSERDKTLEGELAQLRQQIQSLSVDIAARGASMNTMGWAIYPSGSGAGGGVGVGGGVGGGVGVGGGSGSSGSPATAGFTRVFGQPVGAGGRPGEQEVRCAKCQHPFLAAPANTLPEVLLARKCPNCGHLN